MTTPKKYREFWVITSPTLGEIVLESKRPYAEKLFAEEFARDDRTIIKHLVEYAALTEAQDEIKQLKEANANCISLNLHESRVKNLEDEIKRLKEIINKLTGEK
jgi:hypothetical protein